MRYFYYALISVLSLISSWIYVKFDFLHYIEESIYMRYQGVSDGKYINYIQINRTNSYYAESVLDSISRFSQNVNYLINLPSEERGGEESTGNFINIYDLVDNIHYSSYGNLYIDVNTDLMKRYSKLFEHNFGPIEGKLFIYYSGQVDQFKALNSVYEGQLIEDDSIKYVVIGYAGKSFFPELTNDTIEVWYTPLGAMYDTVLKSNIMVDIIENSFFREADFVSTSLISLLVLFSLFGIVKMHVKRKRILFRMTQIIFIAIFLVMTVVLMTFYNTILPFGFFFFCVFVLGEVIFRLDFNT